MCPEFMPSSVGTILASRVTHRQSPASLLPVSTSLGPLAFSSHMPVDILSSLGALFWPAVQTSHQVHHLKASGFHSLWNHRGRNTTSVELPVLLGLFSDRRLEHGCTSLPVFPWSANIQRARRSRSLLGCHHGDLFQSPQGGHPHLAET